MERKITNIRIHFAKYHGCGNDFVIVTEDNMNKEGILPENYGIFAQAACHRKTGVGADGLIIVGQEPLEMIFYNCDGSRAPMCGNGIRCLAKFCFDENICRKLQYSVNTMAGEMGIKIVRKEPFLVCIDMGKPIFTPQAFGVESEQPDFIRQQIHLPQAKDAADFQEMVSVSSCFMGTVHTVLWADEISKLPGGQVEFAATSESYHAMEKLGQLIESHEIYSEKTNVNFVQVLNENTLKLQTYERGVGMTAACGTGACASVVMGTVCGRCKKNTDVILPYGSLHIAVQDDGQVWMTGPAEKICQGIYENMKIDIEK